jgi:mono/diheme cytochrome c family protein
LSTFAAVVLALLWLGGCEKKMPKGDPVAGRELFERGCAVCHHANATQTKVGPGLLGLYKLKALPNGEAVTDENIERWVRNGGGQMPGFKNAISPEQMRDLIAYLKTL